MLEDLITYSDLLFSEMTEPQAPNLLPPGSSLTRTGAVSFHPVEDGPRPGSSRTRVQIVNADTTSIHQSQPPTPVDQIKSPEVYTQEPTAENSAGDEALIVVDPPSTAEPGSSIPKRSYTQDDQLELLFDPGLIPASMREDLPDEYHVSLAQFTQ